MGINWKEFNQVNNKQARLALVREHFTAKNKGFGEGQWNLTEIIAQKDNAATMALHYIAGDVVNGVRARGQLQMLTYRLQVVSRQACMYDKDGTYLNGFDRFDLEGPKPDDKAKPGDVIRIKRDLILRDPDDPEKKVTWKEKNKMLDRVNAKLLAKREMYQGKIRRARMEEAAYEWEEVVVDEEGCITVGIMDALDMLKTKGYGIAKPDFRDPLKTKMGEKPIPERQITNWYYLEVPDDFKSNETLAKEKKKAAAKAAKEAKAAKVKEPKEAEQNTVPEDKETQTPTK
jgi:hypothetical protein